MCSGVFLQVTMLVLFPGELQPTSPLLEMIKPVKACLGCRNIKVMFCLDQPFLDGWGFLCSIGGEIVFSWFG